MTRRIALVNPRNARADQVILEAAIALPIEGRRHGTSTETMATHIGVGETTVYRRGPSKGQLVIEVLTGLSAEARNVRQFGATTKSGQLLSRGSARSIAIRDFRTCQANTIVPRPRS